MRSHWSSFLHETLISRSSILLALLYTGLIYVRAMHTDPAVASTSTSNARALWTLEVKPKANSWAGTYREKRIGELQSQIRSGEEESVTWFFSDAEFARDRQ